ncbi:type 2 isopentenyl-diphosphate Delta-isomerase [Amycolatopsis sp. QT-25]|uniref:type 2 isopentenyl-diphosphate Delta-isomerase n=1 Tax=Amycolatopsis sp. QT-25 TaxID=3034022 RepID=UPI0023EE16F6|nr:type 2 isopentenyl-diphosphate Delta-isomerase [Amycolatopsis sp. QT-25]WET80807.1 type 2 isopentenyl-diphosphate Delta-isomerase [Amycolatopsis sp. QT-25]
MTYADRKDDHVRLAVAQHTGHVRESPYDDVRFLHHALAGIGEAAVSLETEVAGMTWPVPLFVNAMTGGSDRTRIINQGLARAARETGLPIACGSMSAYLADPAVADTYRVIRAENPDGVVIANVNANTSPEAARRAVDLIDADALQIHLNSVQEIVMREGDRDFSAWPRNVERMIAALDVPVVVKEVGFGLSARTIGLLADLGVRTADVSGRGGTNFAAIENSRRGQAALPYLDDWGQSAPACLIEAADVARRRDVVLLASGGVRHPLDVVRALALGAGAVGVSGTFLSLLDSSGSEVLTTAIRDWITQIRRLMVVLGAPTVAALTHTDVLCTGELAEFCRLREIDLAGYGRRSSG